MLSWRTAIWCALATALVGCAGLLVRQKDLDAWVGMPVDALDTHSFFLTVPMIRTLTASGIEIRNYANGQDFSTCSTSSSGSINRRGFISASEFTSCSSGRAVCNNIFYIKDGKVLEYAPTGQCFTNSTVQPEERYLRLKNS